MTETILKAVRMAWLFLLLTLFSGQAMALWPWSKEMDEKPTLAPMFEKVVPAVVNISTTSRVRIEQNPLFNDPFFRRFFDIPNIPLEQERQSLGSGVIVDAGKGYIITNHHVIANADQITVTLRDGSSHEAKVVGTDPEADIAVVQIKAENLTAIPFGDSESLRVGDFVIAIGNPFVVIR